MTKLFKRFISKQDGFITARELQTAAELQARIDDLDVQLTRYSREALAADVERAQAAYIKLPTHENLAKVEEALRVEKSLSTILHRIDPLVKEARAKLIVNEVPAWLKPIWARGLEMARVNLEGVTKQESERILAATGSPMTQSDLVNAAADAVSSLEGIGRSCKFIGVPQPRGFEGAETTPAPEGRRTPVQWLEVFGYGLKGKLTV